MTIETKPKFNMKIVGINLAGFVAYTVICRLIGFGDELAGMFFLALIVGLHFLTCIINAFIERSKEWILSGLIIFLIGPSSCFYVFNLNSL